MHWKYPMKYWYLTLGVLLGMLVFSFAGWRVVAGQQASSPSGEQSGLAAALTRDGTLKAGASGSFDAHGFRMELTAGSAPRFVAAQVACSGWDTQFGPTNGVNDQVNALAVSGTDIYVGGFFTVAGNVSANRVAKFNTLTNTWSALGTGGGNGVDS